MLNGKVTPQKSEEILFAEIFPLSNPQRKCKIKLTFSVITSECVNSIGLRLSLHEMDIINKNYATG